MFGKAYDEVGERACGNSLTADATVTGMVGEQHGRQCPNVEAEALERKARGAVPDAAVNDFRLNG
jgi:hypothetical protein